MATKLRLESSIQSEMIKKLNNCDGCFAYKHCPDPVGYPDIQHSECGVVYLFEVKRSKEHKPSAIQKYMHKKLRKAGYKVFVVWKWSQVEKIIGRTK